jgi:signal transduction histidine kinase
LDVIKPTIALVHFGLAGIEVAIFAFGTLLVRRDIKQLAGWSFFCAFAFLEVCTNIELGAALQSGLSSANRQTALHVYGVLNLASHFLLALFFCQLNRRLSKRFISIFAFVTLLAGGISEYEVAYGDWPDQLMILPIARQIPADLICAFILLELVKRVRREFTFGLGALAPAIATKLILGTSRNVYLMTLPTSLLTIDALPPHIFAWHMLRAMLSAAPILFIFGHWTGILLNYRRTIQVENDQIRTLLKEKTILLDSMADFSRAAEAGGLTAALTHEISQPLSAVALNAAVLKARLKAMETPPEIEALVDNIVFNNSRTNESVYHLRQIFQPVVQGQQASAALIDPKIVLDQILSIVASRARQSKVSVSVENSNPDQVLVRADDLYTLTLNFVLNALDALEESARAEKKITIYIVSTPSALALIVDDNGPGIPPDFYDEVFNLRKTTKPNGMGVGLWLCEQLCRNRGYSISFNSAPNEGTEFKVSFPANSANAGSTERSAIGSGKQS